MVAGFGSHERVRGVDVGAVDDLAVVATLASATARSAGLGEPTGATAVITSQAGDGYGRPTAACREAIGLAARCEGLILDPV